MEAFGPKLDRFCKNQGVSQKALANQLGISRNTITNWKGKGKPPSRNETIKLATLLYLDQDETNVLLASAGYAPEYSKKVFQEELTLDIETVKTKNLMVQHLMLPNKSVLNQQQTRCDYYAQVSPPPRYVERVEVLSDVRAQVLGNTSLVALTSLAKPKPDALHGMGGIGKSIIARALCDDTEVQKKFSDGILWVTLGKQPDLISAIRSWINALGGTVSENAPTIDSLKVTLAEMLKNRACLLILDDIWKRTDAEAFQVGGAQCHLLLTTRDAEIARELGAKVHSIPLMTEDEAITLLEEWAEARLAETGPAVKRRIVKRLGYLPLAVKLAGAQLRRKSAEEWLDSFDIRKLISQRVESIHGSLVRTFELSLDELDKDIRDLYISLAIFKEDEAILQVGIERLWQALDDRDAASTTDLLDDLAARALLEITIRSSSRTVRLHDLLRDLIDAELGDARITKHLAILNAYRAQRVKESWHTVKDDGYLYDHLAYHLHSAGAREDFKELFANHNWLEARVSQQDYIYDGYLEDLNLIWKQAETETRQQIKAKEDLVSFSDCIRYLLIHTSINSLSTNYIPELLVRAVELGLWTTRRALSIAARCTDAIQRAEMYISLMGTKILDRELYEETQVLAIEAVFFLTKEDVIPETLARLFTNLIPYLTGSKLDDGLGIALAIPDETARTEALEVLAPQLTRHLIEKGLKTILTISSEQDFVEVLLALAPYLTEALLNEGLEIALTISDELKRTQVLAALTHELSDDKDDEVLDDGLEAAFSFLSYWEPETQAILASHLTNEQRDKVLERGLEIALSLKNRWKAEALAALAPVLTVPLLERALEAALALSPEWPEAQALEGIAPHLTDALLERAFEATLSFSSEQKRSRIMAILAPHLPDALLEQALEAAFSLSSEGWTQAQVLIGLAPRLTGSLLKRALKASFSLSSQWQQVQVFAALAPHLSEEQRNKVLEHALEAALPLPYNSKYYALVLLVPYLTMPLLKRALEDARLLSDQWEQIKALMNLSPHLNESLLKRGLEIALGLSDDWQQSEALVFLAPYMSGSLRERVLEAALNLSDELKRAPILAALAPQLDRAQRDNVLEYALSTAPSPVFQWRRAELLTILAPNLTGSLFDRGLEVAFALTDEKERARALAAFAPNIPARYTDRMLKIAYEISDPWQQLQVLANLAPRLEGDQRDNVLVQGLEVASTFSDYWKAETLAVLASQLDKEQCDKLLTHALEVALTLPDHQKSHILSVLAPYLTESLLVRGLEIALTLSDAWLRAMTLTSLFPVAPNDDTLIHHIQQTLVDVLWSQRNQSRQEILSTLFIKRFFSPPIFSPEILGAIFKNILDIAESWQWS